MELLMIKSFSKWVAKSGLTSTDLKNVIDEMDRGLLGDRLGAYIFKKRVGLGGKGKRGGVRTILVYYKEKFAVFVYGYHKNEKSDLSL